GEEGLVGGAHGVTVDVALETMLAELAHHRLGPRSRHLHLVEGLHGGEPGDGPRLAVDLRLVLHRAWPSSRRRSETTSRQARAAPPPLSPSETLARAQAWASFSTVRMPLPTAILRP